MCAATVMVAACTMQVEMTAQVISPGDVRFSLDAKNDSGFCLLEASFIAKGGKAPLWSVRRQNGSKAPCPTELRFPLAPPGYDLHLTGATLAPGAYQASAAGGNSHGNVDFVIPAR